MADSCCKSQSGEQLEPEIHGSFRWRTARSVRDKSGDKINSSEEEEEAINTQLPLSQRGLPACFLPLRRCCSIVILAVTKWAVFSLRRPVIDSREGGGIVALPKERPADSLWPRVKRGSRASLDLCPGYLASSSSPNINIII